MKRQRSKEPDRIQYYEDEKCRNGMPSIDEFVIHDAHVHLEKMDDSWFWLNVGNNKHNWTFHICSHSGKALIEACLIEDDSPSKESD